MLKEDLINDSLKILEFTNASNFWRPLQSLLLRYTAENCQVT